MSSEWRAPAPLPMYQPVVLKHVPTMVRRRYDHRLDVDNLLSGQDTPPNDGQIENDGDLDSIHQIAPTSGNISSHQGGHDSEDVDLEDSNSSHEVETGVSVECQQSEVVNSIQDCETETQSKRADNGSIKPTDIQSEQSECDNDESEAVNHDPIVERTLEDETCDKRLASFSNEQGSVSEDDGCDRSEMELLEFIDTDVKDEKLDNGLENSSDDQDEPKNDGEDDGDLDSVKNEDNLGSKNSSCEQGSALEDDDCDGSVMKHSSCIVDTSVKGCCESENDDLQDSYPSSEVDDGISVECQLKGEENSADNCESGTYCESVGTRSIKPTELDSEDSKIKDNWPKLANHAPVVDPNLVEDETTHKRLAFLSNEQGNSKDEYNGHEDAESASYTRIVDKGFDIIEGISVNEQGSSEETKSVRHLSEGNSPFCAIVSLNREAEETGHGSFDDKQDMSKVVYKTEASKKSIMEDRCKSQGRCSPPPLPMYRPVVLKHVPTMVRKRYERSNVEPSHQIEDVRTNDGEFEDDGDLDDEGGPLSEDISSEQGWHEGEADGLQNSNSSSTVDSCVSVEYQHNGVENSFSHCETGIHKSVSSRDIQPTGWHEGEADDLQNSNSSSTVDSCVSVECQQNGVENSISDCETGIHNESVSSRDIQPTDLHSENMESEDDESKVGNSAPIVDSNLDEGESQGKRPSLVLHSEYSESKDDEPEFAYHAAIVDSILENEIQDKRHEDFSNEQGDCKDEYNGAEDAKTASYPSAKYESLDVTNGIPTDEQGLHLEDNKSDADILEGNSSNCTTASLISEAEVIECGSFDDDEQDTITQMYTEDIGTQNILRRSLDKMNLESESNGAEDPNSTYNMHTAIKTEDQLSQWYSNCQKEFKPETLGKIMEENGYELFCPNCKHCFTNPVIVQRKENGQHCRISCITSIIALFCGSRDYMNSSQV